MSAKKFDDNTFDALPDDAQSNLYKGAHVRGYTSKLRTKVSDASGEILYFIRTVAGKRKYRALVAWRPENAEHTDQFVDIDMLRLENTPPPPAKIDEPEPEEDDDDEDMVMVRIKMAEEWIAERKLKTLRIEDAPELTGLLTRYGKTLLRFTKTPRYCPDCSTVLQFDADLVGETCGGNSLRGWDVCTNKLCAKAWISEMAMPAEGEWKLAGGGRSIETGEGRIRVDGGDNVEKLMARILRLPGLELEVERLRTYKDEIEALAKESETVPKKDGLGEPFTNAFRELQHRAYEAMTTIARKAKQKIAGTEGDVAVWIDLLKHDEQFADTDRNELTCAIQYAIKYGRMP